MQGKTFLSILKSYTSLAKDAFKSFVDAVHSLYDKNHKVTQKDIETAIGEPDTKTDPLSLDVSKAITRQSGMPQIGRMYLFGYDARYKDILPFFDMHPLVIPLSYYTNKKGEQGFMGLNLHYIHPYRRAALLDALINNDESMDKKFTQDSQLNINYNILKQYADTYSGYEECLKKYLFSHVRSQFKEIHPKDWGWVVLLPTQEWSINPYARKPASPPVF